MEQYLRLSEIAEKLSVGETTIQRWVAEGRFPKPIRLTKRTSVYRADDVQAAIDKMADQS